MGYFTWTLANKRLQYCRNGDFSAKCKLPYDGFACVVCPDDSTITEICYEGYGMFDGHDIYELVVDWNKDYLEQIFDDLAERNKDREGYWGEELRDLAIAYQHDDTEKIKQILAIHADEYDFLWKRSIGIAIACSNNENIPYPIKITDNVRPKPYAELPPSINCQ